MRTGLDLRFPSYRCAATPNGPARYRGNLPSAANLGAWDQEAALIHDTLARLPTGSPLQAAWIHYLGMLAHGRGDYGEAARQYQRALDIKERLGNQASMPQILTRPDRLDRLAVAEAAMPGVSPSPPLFGSAQADDRLWHFAFNRLAEVNDQLVKGREHLYFGFQFAKAAKELPGYAVRYYVDTLARDPEALRGNFAAYRALDTTITQNQRRTTRRLTLPVLAIGGAEASARGPRTR